MENIALRTKDLDLYYGKFHALKKINFSVYEKSVTALIGPSGCGKSTLLRCFNRLNELIDEVKITGLLEIHGKSIKDIDLVELRRKVGMVFQRPNPFPLSIYDNMVYGLRVHGENKKKYKDVVEKCLMAVGLLDELKDKLNTPALNLVEETKQRLCIARLLTIEPEIILLDEPCSALDPIATMRVEELMIELKKDYTIIIVTHNMQQAARVSDYTGFMLLGELIEFDETPKIFTSPKDERTEGYITGRFG